MSRFLCACLILAASACGPAAPPDPTPPPDAALRDSVEVLLAALPVALAAEGPTAWLRFFESSPAFFMASDGQVAFAARDSAAVFLDGFAPQVAAMELTWEDVRIEPMAPGVAVVAAAYRERITSTNGTVTAFGGYVTGVARRHAGRWTLQHLHWSSPAPPAE